MKLRILRNCLFWGGMWIASIGSAHSGEVHQPLVMNSLPKHVFVPGGFDDNDLFQFVHVGELTDTCEKLGPVKVDVDKKSKQILVTQSVYRYQGCWCASVLVPYTQTVEVGVLPAGNYKISFVGENGGEKVDLGQVQIASASTSAPDEHTYAPVISAHFDYEGEQKTPVLILEGKYLNECMKYKETRVIATNPDVIEVLPIVEINEDVVCAPTTRPFRISVNLSRFDGAEKLYHIRSLNGKALNLVR